MVFPSAADAMKMALQRKASKKLVDRKEDVLALIDKASGVRPATMADAVLMLGEVEDIADELGLPLTGDEWGERLAIKKKGGGLHFDDGARSSAALAYSRLGVVHSAVTWHKQLANRRTQIRSTVSGFRTKGGSGATLSKGKMLERCTELLDQARKTMADIFGDKSFKSSLAEMRRLEVPQELEADSDELRRALIELADFGGELAKAELAGLHAEKKLTQRFRAPQTLSILSAAHKLLGDVHVAAQPTAAVEEDELQTLVHAIEEVRPMVGGAQGEDDELDDEI